MADFEARSSEEIIEILQYGANVTISARYQTIGNLITMAQWAKNKNSTLTLRDTDTLDQAALIQIAQHGGKNIVLEIRVSDKESE